jgi:hypothetical protein
MPAESQHPSRPRAAPDEPTLAVEADTEAQPGDALGALLDLLLPDDENDIDTA